MAAEPANEQEIQFRKRARRRLVGAIALVLLMVAVLPMLLDDHSTKAPQQEIAINIPSQDDSDFTSRVVPESAETQPTETPETVDAATPNPTPAEPTAAPANETAPAAEPVPTDAAKQAVAKPESKPAQSTTAADAHAVQIGVFSTMASIRELQQKLLAQGYKSYTERIATEQGEKIRLRAGPFSSRDEAEKALGKIKSAGMPGMVVSK